MARNLAERMWYQEFLGDPFLARFCLLYTYMTFHRVLTVLVNYLQMIQNCIELYLGLKTRKLCNVTSTTFVHGVINGYYVSILRSVKWSTMETNLLTNYTIKNIDGTNTELEKKWTKHTV